MVSIKRRWYPCRLAVYVVRPGSRSRLQCEHSTFFPLLRRAFTLHTNPPASSPRPPYTLSTLAAPTLPPHCPRTSPTTRPLWGSSRILHRGDRHRAGQSTAATHATDSHECTERSVY